jgi:hypothetical protein
MQHTKSTAPHIKTAERKPTTVKPSPKSKAHAQSSSQNCSQSKLECGKANLKKLLRRIE